MLLHILCCLVLGAYSREVLSHKPLADRPQLLKAISGVSESGGDGWLKPDEWEVEIEEHSFEDTTLGDKEIMVRNIQGGKDISMKSPIDISHVQTALTYAVEKAYGEKLPNPLLGTRPDGLPSLTLLYCSDFPLQLRMMLPSRRFKLESLPMKRNGHKVTLSPLEMEKKTKIEYGSALTPLWKALTRTLRDEAIEILQVKGYNVRDEIALGHLGVLFRIELRSSLIYPWVEAPMYPNSPKVFMDPLLGFFAKFQMILPVDLKKVIDEKRTTTTNDYDFIGGAATKWTDWNLVYTPPIPMGPKNIRQFNTGDFGSTGKTASQMHVTFKRMSPEEMASKLKHFPHPPDRELRAKTLKSFLKSLKTTPEKPTKLPLRFGCPIVDLFKPNNKGEEPPRGHCVYMPLQSSHMTTLERLLLLSKKQYPVGTEVIAMSTVLGVDGEHYYIPTYRSCQDNYRWSAPHRIEENEEIESVTTHCVQNL